RPLQATNSINNHGICLKCTCAVIVERATTSKYARACPEASYRIEPKKRRRPWSSRLRRPWGVRFRSPPGETASGFHNWRCKPGAAKKVAGEFARGTYNVKARCHQPLGR